MGILAPMETLNCPKCSATHEVSALPPPSYGESVKALLKDWRIWAIAFATTLILGVLSGGLGMGQSYVGAVSGGLIGVTMWLRMRRMRQCPGCGAVFVLPGLGSKPA